MIASFDEPMTCEGDAAAYIAALRWPNGPICPWCRETRNIAREGDFAATGRYVCPRCRRNFSPATGTMIAKSAVTLQKWLSAFDILAAGAPGKSLDTILRGIFHPVDTDPDIRLSVDGRIVQPDIQDPVTYAFAIDAPPMEVLILSRYFVPGQQDPSSTDMRRLGVGISALTIQEGGTTTEWDHDDPALVIGFHGAEAGQRWTTGRAVVPAEYFSRLRGPFVFTIKLSHRNGVYPIGDESDRA